VRVGHKRLRMYHINGIDTMTPKGLNLEAWN